MSDQQQHDQKDDATLEQEKTANADDVIDEQTESGNVEQETIEVDPVEALQEEVNSMKDKLLRNQAEMENLRRRTTKEVADARKFAVERFATSLLDVVDNLERALEVEEGNEEAVRDGVQLTLDAWHKVMGNFKIERIDATGEAFDPHQHEALSKMPNELDEGIVIAQHCAGYTLNGRLIRPAKVLVSSGPAE